MNVNHASSAATTYYEVLELDPSASPLDIKKAYRRLALLYHPDRLRTGQQLHSQSGTEEVCAEATERFKAVSQAYQVLSDPEQRVSYDSSLRHQQTATTPDSSSTSFKNKQYASFVSDHNHPFVDPFVQFDSLFRNNAFFRAAFDGMDDEFAKQFSSATQQESHMRNDNDNNSINNNSSTEGWFPWLLRQCGVQVQMTSYRRDSQGNVTASSYSSSNPNHTRNRSTYRNQQVRTFRQSDGRLATVRTLEKDGNVLEERHADGVLVERRINGTRAAANGYSSNQSSSRINDNNSN